MFFIAADAAIVNDATYLLPITTANALTPKDKPLMCSDKVTIPLPAALRKVFTVVFSPKNLVRLFPAICSD